MAVNLHLNFIFVQNCTGSQNAIARQNFYPESLTFMFENGRYPGLRLNCHLPIDLLQWYKKQSASVKTKHTVAGTALESN